MKKLLLLASISLGMISGALSQEGKSNVQTFTPSKLLAKGQWDIKFFNSLYTQTEQTGPGSKKGDVIRQTFFTNTNEIYTGISNNSRLNVGLIFQVRSTQVGGNSFHDALGVLRFLDDEVSTRSGFTTIAPSIRFQPFRSIANFSITSSFFFPIFKETRPGTGEFQTGGNGELEEIKTPFLDQRSFAWENKFFYDYTFGKNRWQIFTEVDTKFNFGEDSGDASPNENAGERFANESLFLPLSAFLSYFPTSKSTIFGSIQQSFLIDLGNEFDQNSTAFGFGGKYQVTSKINVEVSYGNIFRGQNFQGLGETYSIGLRAIL